MSLVVRRCHPDPVCTHATCMAVCARGRGLVLARMRVPVNWWIVGVVCVLSLTLPGMLARGGERFASLDAAMGEALAGTGREQPLVLAVFGTESCGACRAIKAATLSDEAWQRLSNPPLLVEIDAYGERGTAQAFGIRVIPALFLLTGEGKVVAMAEGFHDTEALEGLLEKARARLASGEWEGQAADRSRKGRVETPTRLVESLGVPDATVRGSAAWALLEQRESAMPALLEGLSHPYLGVRVGCADLIHRLAPEAPEVNPWLPKAERDEEAAALARWWQRTRTLPPASALPPSPARDRDIESALAALDSRNPVERTRGMTRLAHHGRVVLPELARLRERAIRTEDNALRNLIEDLRWALLVPPNLETTVRVRLILARGESRERQEATLRLVQGVEAALPAVVALSQDEDPLVREQSIHALRRIRSPVAMQALGDLLGSEEANLRMVAAQVIGETRNASHARMLVPVLTDPDEVVATTAIAAFGALRPRRDWELLRPCIEDPRWRVRAAAAEVLGGLDADGYALLMPLLGDEDPFVVHTTLQSLRRLRKMPEPEELRALLQESPELIEVILQLLVDQDENRHLPFVAELIDTLEPPHVGAVLDVLAGRENARHREDGNWVPIFNRLLRSESAAIRLRGVSLLELRSAPLARRYLGHFLDDPDPEVRQRAARVLLSTLAFGFGLEGEERAAGHGAFLKSGIPAAHPAWVAHLRELPVDADAYQQDRQMRLPPLPSPETPPDEKPEETASSAGRANLLRYVWRARKEPPEPVEPAETRLASRPGRGHPLMRESHFIAAHMEDWHRRLSESPDRETDPATLWAWFLTGDGVEGFDEILVWMRDPAHRAALRELGENRMIGLLLARGSWSENLPLLDALLADPSWYPALYAFPGLPGHEEMQERLHEPQRLLAYLQTAEPASMRAVLEILLQGGGNRMSLFHSRQEELRGLLRASSQPLARALGVYTLQAPDVDSVADVLTPFLDDPDPWVRHAAVQSAVHLLREHRDREPLLMTRLEDPHPETAMLAAMALLHDAYWDIFPDNKLLTSFVYGEEHIRAGHDPVRSSRGLPPEVMTATPEVTRHLLDKYRIAREAEGELEVPVLLLALAQYGNTEILDEEIERFVESGAEGYRMRSALLWAARFHSEPGSIRLIRHLLGTTRSSWDMMRLLSSIPDVPSPEFRALRREINARIRESERVSETARSVLENIDIVFDFEEDEDDAD